MKLITPLVEIPPGNPFANDVLRRKDFADSLISLIEQTSEGCVLSIEAPWGDGKTTFVQMWRAHLDNEQFRAIYFDAFAHDYLDDPFVGLAGELLERLPRSNEARGEFKRRASKAGAQLLAWGTKLGIRAATLGIVKSEEIDGLREILSDAAKDVSEVTSSYIEERLSAYENDRNALDEFRAFLEDLAKGTGKPLIFIVDELDRCRPTYAINLIERIKHVFSVPGVIFVLVMNKQQLAEAVRCVYGLDVDAVTYVQKFIDIECHLPKDTSETYGENDYIRFAQYLYRVHEMQCRNEADNVVKAMALFGRLFGLSLRGMQRASLYVALFYASTSQHTLSIAEAVCLLSVLRVCRPNLYRELAQGRFQDAINEPVLKDLLKQQDWLGDILRFLLLSDDEMQKTVAEERRRDFMQTTAQHSLGGRLNIIPFFCHRIDLFTPR